MRARLNVAGLLIESVERFGNGRHDVLPLLDTALPGKVSRPHQESVDFSSGLSALADTPDNEGLASVTIASSKDAWNVGRIAL